MNNNLHELVFVLDQSAAIEPFYAEAEKGFQAMIASQEKSETMTNVTIDVFGDQYLTFFDNTPIKELDLSKKLFPCSGVCPMIDSAIKAIDDVGIRLNRTYEGSRPSKVIVTIVTFGRDNASKHNTFNDLAEIIRVQTEVYKWSFFLLTDFSINMEKLNIPEENTVIVKKNEPKAFINSFAELNEKITALRSKTASENAQE